MVKWQPAGDRLTDLWWRDHLDYCVGRMSSVCVWTRWQTDPAIPLIHPYLSFIH